MAGIHAQVSSALFEHVLVAIYCLSFACLLEHTCTDVPSVGFELFLAAMCGPVLDVSVFVGYACIR